MEELLNSATEDWSAAFPVSRPKPFLPFLRPFDLDLEWRWYSSLPGERGLLSPLLVPFPEPLPLPPLPPPLPAPLRLSPEEAGCWRVLPVLCPPSVFALLDPSPRADACDDCGLRTPTGLFRECECLRPLLCSLPVRPDSEPERPVVQVCTLEPAVAATRFT